jgi:hypothetical protein
MITIDLELAKKLQSVCNEKGIKMPNSEDVWAKKRYHTSPYIIYGEEGVYPKWLIHATDAYAILAPAYTLDELLEILPATIQADNEEHTVYFKSVIWGLNSDQWYVGYIYLDEHYKWFADTNPCDAAGKLLIWCIQEGYLK